MLVPDKLAKDYRELEYIEGIGKSKITAPEHQVCFNIYNRKSTNSPMKRLSMLEDT